MAEAEVKLTSALNEEGGRERLNVENLNDEQERVVPDIDFIQHENQVVETEVNIST